jgi:hypothetical protein
MKIYFKQWEGRLLPLLGAFTGRRVWLRTQVAPESIVWVVRVGGEIFRAPRAVETAVDLLMESKILRDVAVARTIVRIKLRNP